MRSQRRGSPETNRDRCVGFARLQRRARIDDAALCRAVREAEAGLIDADLGGGLLKQRVARAGQGKRGGYRALLAYRAGDRAAFLYGFAKSERDNIDQAELGTWRSAARGVLAMSEDAIEQEIIGGDMTEVECDDEA